MRIIILGISLVFLMSCTKDQRMYDEQNYNTVNSHISFVQTTTDIVAIVDSIMHISSDSAVFNGVLFEKEMVGDSIEITLNFGDTTDTDPDGKKRSGIMMTTYPVNFNNTGSQYWCELESLGVNGVLYQGTMKVTYDGWQSGFRLFTVFVTDLSQVIFGQSGVLQCELQLKSEGIYDDAWMKGDFSCTGELAYSSTIVDSIYHDPLTKYYERGKCNLVRDDFTTQINYGDGQQDKLATATADLFRYIIDLTSF
ncbi:MAG: hypothetical protein IPP69_07570 [Flavobacteriales bacterium]|nr:hypothetical protein [Flavobacteriales bacterium]